MAKRGASADFALEDDAVDRLWRKAKKPDDRVLVGLTMMEGLRVGEAIHLKQDWVRTTGEHSEISIPAQMECGCWECSKRGGYRKPKSAAGVRIIPIVDTLQPHLLKFLGYQPYGLGYVRQTGWRIIKGLAEEAGITYLSPHVLRATAATTFAKAGFTAQELCYVMGWSRIEMGSHYIQIVQARAGVAAKMKGVYRGG